MSEPTFGDSVGDSVKTLTKTLKELENQLSKIVGLSKDLKTNFTEANSAVSSFSSSARSAKAGGAGGTGAGREAMSGNLGNVSDTRGEAPSMGFGGLGSRLSGGVGGAAAGAMGGGGLRGMAGGFMRGAGGPAGLALGAVMSGVSALGTVHQMGRVGYDRAMELEWMNYRATQTGSDFSKLLANINPQNIGLSGQEASQAAMQWGLMGLDRPGAGLSLSSNLSISRLTGQSAMEGLQAGTAYRAPNRIYQLQAMGVQVMNPDGSTRGEADVANQLFNRFYGGNKNISLDDLKQSFDPHIGAITNSLRSAGYGDDEIARMKRMFEEKVQNGGPITDQMLESTLKAELPEGQAAAGGYEFANMRKDVEFFDDSIRGASEAIKNMTGTINNLVDDETLNRLNSFGNYVGAANDAFKAAGFDSFAAGLGTAGVAAGNMGGGGGQSVKPPSKGGTAAGDWNVNRDRFDRIHQGEMVLPAVVANAVRNEVSNPANAGRPGLAQGAPRGGGGSGANVTINVTVQRASDAEAIRFAREVKRIIDRDHEMSTLGLGQVVL